MNTRSLIVAVAATASLVVACGGAEETPTQPAADKNQQAMLDYARCMREHGVDMPDPKFDGGRVTMRINSGPGKENRDTVRAAEQACAKYQAAIKPPELSDAERAEFRRAALAHARCMREHGVDMPDPTFDSSGGARMRMDGSVDPKDPKVRRAQRACQGELPGPSTTDADER